MTQCCHKCFHDEFLSEKIRTEGAVDRCSLCGENELCLGIDALREIFRPLVSLYTRVEEFLPMQAFKDLAGENETLAECIAEQWDIFDDASEAQRFLELCCETSIDRRHLEYWDPFDPEMEVGMEDVFFHGEHEKTRVLSTLWTDLKRELHEENRYLAGRNIINNIRQVLLTDLIRVTLREEVFCRVRSTPTNVALKAEEMGAPPASLSSAGRANPPGIPYLYLASDQNTAICEVRPHNQDRLTVGFFRIASSITCVDLRDPRIKSPFRHGSGLHDLVVTLGFLGDLGRELSLPIGSDGRDRDYLSTQYLCELIKNLGFDGVLYKSGLSDGYNVALFNTNSAYCVETKLVRVESVEITVADVTQD
jgi:hypothetical protein